MDKKPISKPIKNIAILGSTGNIGQQALDVIEKNEDYYKLKLLTAQKNVELLIHQALKYRPNMVYLGDPSQRKKLSTALSQTPIIILDHEKQIYETFLNDDLDLVLLAIVGFAGLKPAIQVIQAGKNLAIANKESLVVGGQLLMDLAKHNKVQILPVDSEHSAIFQCLQGEEIASVEKIILTASGGPFFDLSNEEMKIIHLKQALKHPTWQMGNKITIDSASMMNKGLEVIEAKWLFDLETSQIEVVVHPQSSIHSMVQFIDGSIKAQMSPPDMRGPIQYALQFPQRHKSTLTRFNFSEAFDLSFKPIDMKKFRNLALAFEALKKGGNMPAILNAANEASVEAVLQERLPFFRIAEVVEEMMSQMKFIENPNYDDLIETHLTTIEKSNQLIRRKK
jgi:1-deoxy-D-xylulose-5-phosphate reductoisomerase